MANASPSPASAAGVACPHAACVGPAAARGQLPHSDLALTHVLFDPSGFVIQASNRTTVTFSL
ncbi:MAG: hypothetical protein ACJA0V_000053 [Planctomycetota bacterium]|jgi:hypothetical protein